jgi:putative sugar O-methyltransferase
MRETTEGKMNKLLVYLTCIGIPLFGAETSASDSESYRSICRKASEDEFYFAQFKNIHAYREILEHLGKEHGQMYLNLIKYQTPEFLEMIETFRKNDLYGTPKTEVFEGIGTISSTTLRYMKVASDLKLLYGSSLNQKSIVEIGGGYGGQCLILSAIYNFENYTIVDLPEPLALTKKYLEKHNIHHVTYKRFDETIDGEFDLVISNYAFSECSSEMRKKYTEEILSHSKRGYLTGYKPTLVEYMDDFHIPYEIWSENPCTNPGNIFVTWNE